MKYRKCYLVLVTSAVVTTRGYGKIARRIVLCFNVALKHCSVEALRRKSSNMHSDSPWVKRIKWKRSNANLAVVSSLIALVLFDISSQNRLTIYQIAYSTKSGGPLPPWPLKTAPFAHI